MKEAADAFNHNFVRNSNAFISNDGKIDPDFEFSWINDSYVKSQQKFQLGNQVLDPINDERLLLEILLPAKVWLTVFELASTYDLINLAHTSKHLRCLVLFKFSIYFE